MDKLEFIANVRYLGWICYQMGAGLPLHDVSKNNTYKISEERLKSLIAGTRWALDNPDATPEDNHSIWLKAKAEQGYKYGEYLDVNNKTHPSMVPFEELPDVEQRKDEMDLLMTKLANILWEEVNIK